MSQAIKVTGKIIEQWMPMKIGYDHTPGAVICIAVDGVPKYLNSFGVSDIEKQTKLEKDAQFRVASMSKMFTAVSVLQLQEQGKLRLDDKVVEYLPWFTGKSRQTNLANVSIRQLLSHNAGLFRDGTAKQWMNDKFPKSLEGTITDKAIVFDNASTLKYSNHGYAVLGDLIEKVSGESYVDYTTKHIIKPLNLKNTLPDLPNEVPVKLVPGYQRWVPDMNQRNTEPHIQTHAYASATGFVSNAKDLSVFLAALHPDSKKKILNRESRKAMRQVQTILNKDEMYGLGLSLESLSGEHIYGHSGGFAGYITNAISHLTDNIQVVVLTNTISGTAENVSHNLMRLIYKIKNLKDVEFLDKDPYSGLYRNRWGDAVIVSLGNKLVEFSPSSVEPANAWTEFEKQKQHVFKNTDKSGLGAPGETITFKKIKDGKAILITSDWRDAKRIY